MGKSVASQSLPKHRIFHSHHEGSGLMKYIPISSKQIAYISYDDESSKIHIQYHTGHSQVCEGVDHEQIKRLIESVNPYDLVMRLTNLPPALTHTDGSLQP
jgi:hypothetical protein